MLLVLLGSLVFIAVVLTYAMFHTREAMLGFPCAMFWAILGGYAYTQSVAVWDIYYFLFFASLFGMTIFCTLAAYGLREKRDSLADEEDEQEGETEEVPEYFGEEKESKKKTDDLFSTDEERSNPRVEELRGRAKKRRSGGRKKRWQEPNNW